MFLAPTLFFLAYGLLGVYSWAWYVYLIGLAGVTAVLQAVLRWARRLATCCGSHHTTPHPSSLSLHTRLYLPGNPSTPLPVGLVFATKFWLYYTVFTVAFPGEFALPFPLPPHLPHPFLPTGHCCPSHQLALYTAQSCSS